MSHELQFYIDGAWVDPVVPNTIDVIDPSDESAFAQISLGSQADVDKAVAAAKRAFATFGFSPVEERIELLERIVAIYRRRSTDLALAVSREMGAPRKFALENQVGIGLAHLTQMVETLRSFEFREERGKNLIVKEPIGVVGLICPWNWPLNQITCKVAPAIAAGCTMVLKPSEIAPLDAIIFAEIMDEAGTPKGVFNLVNGDGPTVGEALAPHPKRVHQELGGKSANILFDDVDLATAVTKGVAGCYLNSGQSCNAPTRMFVPREKLDEAASYAKAAAETFAVGPAAAPDTNLGPGVSELQFKKIQDLIASGIEDGATLVTGGPGRPAGLNRGYYVRPTVFADVTPDMRIAREEIFGPVLSILPYDSEEEVVATANDTVYGLASYIQTKDLEKARRIAARMRTGNVYINYPAWDAGLPFGGYKQSGNGREYGAFGLDDFLEIKGIAGYQPAE